MKTYATLYRAMVLALLVFACVPRTQYVESENRLMTAEAQLREAEARLAVVENQNEALQKEHQTLQAQRDQLQTDLEQCEKVNAKLSQSIKNLADRAQKLKLELEKQKSVVYLQDQVIKLLDDTRKTIESSLKDQIASQGIELVESEDALKVVLIDRILYDPGSVEINEEGKRLLRTLADTFKRDEQYHIVVEGHTDSLPLGGDLKARYPTNWELSAARAAAVVRFLQWKCEIDPKRLSLRGYSYYRPVASNRTEKGRSQNRRIEIILGPPR
jgi:chemotaxis protein MotB